MTIQRIVKMEFFKFFHEKVYMLVFGIIAVLNIIFALVLANAQSLPAELYGNKTFGSFMIISIMLLIAANFILLYWYPFHVLSVNYNNDVLALMMASGIKRKHLFYAKLIVTICLSMLAAVVLLLIPGTLLVVELNKNIGMLQLVFSSFMDNFSWYYLVDLILAYITTVTLMLLACTWMRGAKKAILVFIGLTWVYRIVTSLTLIVIPTIDMNEMGHYLAIYGVQIIAMVLFGYITQRIMAKQNL